MIRELLEERTQRSEDITNTILKIYEDKLTRSVRFFVKTDRDIQITSVYLYPFNRNFVVNICKILVEVGDKIQQVNGDIVEVTEENIDSLNTNEMTIILPYKDLENKSAIELFNLLEFVNDFIGKHGFKQFDKVLKSGIESFNDIIEKEDYTYLLEELTDPFNDIYSGLDNLQKLQYDYYIKNNKIH